MDISKDLEAKSDQLNAIDLSAGSVVVTIVGIKRASDQRISIITDVFGDKRPFKPSKTVARILANAWKSPETDTWIGKRMELFRDPSVRWAGEEVGGIRIKGLSHIDKPFKISLQASKSTYAKYVIEPLPDAPKPRDWLQELEQMGGDMNAIEALGRAAGDDGADAATVQRIRAAWNKARQQATESAE